MIIWVCSIRWSGACGTLGPMLRRHVQPPDRSPFHGYRFPPDVILHNATVPTRAIDRAAIERLLTRRDVPLREKTLWSMLYETAARASEILALDVADLDLDARSLTIEALFGLFGQSRLTFEPRRAMLQLL